MTAHNDSDAKGAFPFVCPLCHAVSLTPLGRLNDEGTCPSCTGKVIFLKTPSVVEDAATIQVAEQFTFRIVEQVSAAPSPGKRQKKDARLISLAVIGLSAMAAVFLTLPLTLTAIGVLSENENENLLFMWLWAITAVVGGFVFSPMILLGGIVAVCLQRTWLSFIALLCSFLPLAIVIVLASGG